MRVGIVCEGSTDFAVLRVLCGALLGTKDLAVTLLQPRFDEVGAPGSGWQGVRRFLQKAGAGLGAAGHDVIVVHVDADIRHLPEVAKHLAQDDDVEDLAPLCDHVKGWMAGGVPESVVVVLPREATEAWLCAIATRRADVESLPRPAEELRAAGIIGEREGKAEKLTTVYAAQAEALAGLVRDQRKLAKVPELARFVGKIGARAKTVRKAGRA